MRSLKEILEENGHQPPPEHVVDIPEWQEPVCKPKRWMTIGDLFCGCGSLIGFLGSLIQNLIAVALWIAVTGVLLQIFIGGCSG
jgi:hypothetical protein